MVKPLNKGLDESDKKEGLLKRLKNIEGKNEQQLEAIKDQGEGQLEAISSYNATKIDQKKKEIEFNNKKNQEAKEIVDDVNKIIRENKYKKFACSHSNETLYNFNTFSDIKQLGNDIFNGNVSIKEVKDDQDEMKKEIIGLESYNPIKEQRIKSF